jgi:hypothetical protein
VGQTLEERLGIRVDVILGNSEKKKQENIGNDIIGREIICALY